MTGASAPRWGDLYRYRYGAAPSYRYRPQRAGRSDLHRLDPPVPSLDDRALAERELERLPAPAGRVEDRPVLERAHVVHAYLVARSWEPAGARPLDGFHQALTGEVDDASLADRRRRLEAGAVRIEATGDAHLELDVPTDAL